jgi:ABC-type phosphate/phosphonate transport system substrate-binding protein
MPRHYRSILFVLACCSFSYGIRTQAADNDVITFVAAPLGSQSEQLATYTPLAEYLSQRSGRPVRFVPVADWLSYRKAILDNSYDLYFNGPHFSAWLMDYRHHRLVARLAESHTLVAIAKSDNPHVATMADLEGRKCCLHAPPNLATEIFQSTFTNPTRQPYTVAIEGWKAAFDGVVNGQCDGAVLPDAVLATLNTGRQVKILHRFRTIANLALTANPRLPPSIIDALQSAMLAPTANVAGENILRKFASQGFAPANPLDYAGASAYLKDDFLLGAAVTQGDAATNPNVPRPISGSPAATKPTH